ncbi:hypothetical protein [Bradyrhizobium betae]|uniref:hypothetical protein n=1 Tax=Bradyrhizobium betae TaxID=244734 RepID=UPI00100F5BFB|nr:hypothetical protein [Bradyrhizobium betae]
MARLKRLSNGSWTTSSIEEHLSYVRNFGDAIEEINHCGVDLPQFAPEGLASLERAHAYVGLPWLSRRAARTP